MSITKLRLGLAVLLLGVSLLSYAQDEAVPKHVQVAREFAANTAPEDNHYVDRGGMYTRAPGDFFSKKYVVNTDCKGFVYDVIKRAYGFSPNFSGRSSSGGNSVSIIDWVNGTEKGEVFDKVMHVQDLKVGDYAMWSHEANSSGAHGHIVMMDKLPRKMEHSRVEGLDQWEIYVLDTTGHAHSADDSRYTEGTSAAQSEGYAADGKTRNGVGTGRMYLYADADGVVKAVSYGFQKSKIQNTWHIVLGRVRVPMVASAR